MMMASKPFRAAPDADARRRALDPTQSFWVQAPAGSGKTELLIQRYLTVLTRVAEPESVVAITFTIKAAGEMRDRVLKALAEAEGPEPSETHALETWRLARAALEHDQAQGWQLRETPARMRIETFDALCLSLARRLPVMAGLGGQPEIEDQPEYLYARAAHRTVCLVEEVTPEGKAVRTLLHHLGNDLEGLSAWFASLLTRRDQWLELLSGISNPVTARPHLEAHLAATPGLEPNYSEREWTLLEALLTLLPHALMHLRQEFERTGKVDFAEVSLAALRALGSEGEPTDLGLAIGSRLEHLLIDEMQDTSRTHLKIIQALLNGWDAVDNPELPRTLFLVGDPMQSIYRFREADVGIALDLASGDARLPVELETVRLRANFRSVPGVVDWVNTAFAQIFGMEDDANRGAVGYAASDATRPAAKGKAVSVHPFIGKDRLKVARRVADLAQRAVDAGERTAILVRARTHLPEILAEIRTREDLRYHALEIDTLAERPVVSDLLALTRALLHPADRISWLAVLRAPWCGLTLADLHAIAGPVREAIPALLAQTIDGISKEGAARLARVAPILLSSMDRARRKPLRALVEEAWVALGGPECLLTAGDEADSRVFFDLLAALDSGGAVRSFGELEARTARLFARPDPTIAKPMLEIMTIHNAKGLEFDTVIVPCLERQTQGDDPKLLEWTWDDGLLLVSPRRSDWDGGEDSPLLERIKDIEKGREAEESKRLLYVAATRAREHLHLVAQLDLKKDGGFKKASSNSLLHHLWPIVEPDFERARHAPAETEPEQSLFLFPASRVIRRVGTRFAGGSLPADPAEAPYAVTFEWVGETLRHVGKTVHAWLHRMAVQGAGLPDAASIRRALVHAGVAYDELDFAASRVERALQATLADPRGEWLLKRRDADQREYAITGIVAGEPVRGIVDCTFVENGVRWIVDFKTSYHSGGGLDDFLDNERLRYEAQLGRYAALLRHLGPEPIQLGLYFPLLQGWREWTADDIAVSTTSG